MKYSLRDLELLASQSTPQRIGMELLFARQHEKILSLINEAVDWIIQEQCKTRHLRVNRNEDELTIDVITALVGMGFDASHDTQFGGHVDIVVEAANDFLWLAEAKVHSSYDWLIQGFQQLDTRYSTGLPGQESGAMLIYCRNKNAKAVLDEYISRLSQRRRDLKIEKSGDLEYNSKHIHSVSGLEFRIRHVIFPLHFEPADKKIVN